MQAVRKKGRGRCVKWIEKRKQGVRDEDNH
jgi:hypothetical protein